MKISELIPDDKNYNQGNEFGNSLIEKSLRKNGAGRSILIDKNNRIIAGNKTVENAASIGLEDLLIVETDGTKIIAVKRTDIDLDSKAGREMALADNATSKANIVWNHENLKDDWGDEELKGWGIEGEITDEETEFYSKNITAPTYTPSEEKPKFEQLVNREKAENFIKIIGENSELTGEEKEFLTLAAFRHYVFDYGKIADYYAHSPKHVQKIMEKLALVIIDFDKAIENGYIKLTQELQDAFIEDYGE